MEELPLPRILYVYFLRTNLPPTDDVALIVFYYDRLLESDEKRRIMAGEPLANVIGTRHVLSEASHQRLRAVLAGLKERVTYVDPAFQTGVPSFIIGVTRLLYEPWDATFQLLVEGLSTALGMREEQIYIGYMDMG